MCVKWGGWEPNSDLDSSPSSLLEEEDLIKWWKEVAMREDGQASSIYS